MKKMQTNSNRTFIMEDKDKRFIRQYKRKSKGVFAYPRTVPIDKIFKLLDGSGVKHPKLLRNRLKYIDIEYIKGEVLMVEPNLSGLITLVNDYLYEMFLIDCSPIMKYAPWTSSKEYLNFLIDNMINSIDYYGNYAILESIGLRKEMLLAFKNRSLDENRSLRLIHGEIIPENIICSGDGYFLIDWELATYGDVAYELASHLISVEYTKSAKEELIEKVCINSGDAREALMADVKTYIEFEYTRRCFSIMNRVIENIKKGKPFDNLLDDGFKYYKMFFSKVTKEDVIEKLKRA